MAHPSEDLIRKGFAAFSAGDLDTVRSVLADDVVWHVPGRSPLAGEYKGWGEVSGLFAQTMELTGGTFKVAIHDVLANDEHGVALVTATGQRNGKSLSDNGVQVVHIRDGKVAESWLHPGDAYANDEFWS